MPGAAPAAATMPGEATAAATAAAASNAAAATTAAVSSCPGFALPFVGAPRTWLRGSWIRVWGLGFRVWDDFYLPRTFPVVTFWGGGGGGGVGLGA